MSGWQLDDKAWVKQRREQWKSMQKRINELRFLRKEFKPAIKQYFLTGECTEDLYPLSKLDIAPLIEMWFDPDASDENWQRIKEKYSERHWSDSKRQFRNVVMELGYSYSSESNESFFDGKEERFYDLFFDRRLQRGSYSELNDSEFREFAWRSFVSVAVRIKRYLAVELPNPYNIVWYQLEEWRDAIEFAFDKKRVEYDRVIQAVDKILLDPSIFCEEKVRLAERVSAILSDDSLPIAAKDKLAKVRARPCHPFCD